MRIYERHVCDAAKVEVEKVMNCRGVARAPANRRFYHEGKRQQQSW